MSPCDAGHDGKARDGWTRREFLRAGTVASLGCTLPAVTAALPGRARRERDVNFILLFLVGGPSHIDTWDPKPDAPQDIRGPFNPICTSVPGMQISELFPRMARQADKYSLIRSVHHTAAAIHETGQQLLQTGRLISAELEYPHLGSSLGYLKGARGNLPAHVLTPFPMGRTGANLPHGQGAGFLGRRDDPLIVDPSAPGRDHLLDGEPQRVRDFYGRTEFGQSCLLALRLIETGVRFVTVNMFATVFDEITWDMHGSRPFSDLTDLEALVAPNFDQAFSALLEDLSVRGLLDSTVVTAMGEFGRTPRINPAGGRDHHPGVWTILMGGGPIKGGRIVGASDKWGHAPASRPVTPAEVAATIYEAAGINCRTEIPLPSGGWIPLVERNAAPIKELF
jgi:hypothetical protein